MQQLRLFALVIPVWILLAFSAQGDVFNLRDGTTLAGNSIVSSKPGDDSRFLKVQTLTGTVDIFRGDILSIEKERKLKKDLDKMRSKIDKDDIAGLEGLAGWCRRKGLYREMFAIYDTILSSDPLSLCVNSFIDEMALTIDYNGFRASLTPEIIPDLLVSTAESGQTLRRIGEKILLRIPGEALAPVLLMGIDSKDKEKKAEALRLLKMARPILALEPLIGIALFDKSKKDRDLALNALSSYEHEGIIFPFIRTLRLNNRDYRMNALEGLSRLGDMRAAGAIISNLAPSSGGGSGKVGRRAHIFVGSQKAALTGFEPAVASSSAAAAPIVSILQEGVLLDVSVYGIVQSVDKKEQRMIAEVLKKLSGVDYGTDYILWKEWWYNNKKKIFGEGT